MSRNSRADSRVRRNNRNIEKAECVQYVIVTDTKGTEKIYFDGLRSNLPEEVRGNIVIRTYETHLRTMIDKCLELMQDDLQHRNGWLVFDRDEVKDFDEMIRKAEKYGLHCAWSNPCFEIWLYAYYGKMPAFMNSQQCWKSFGEEYERRTGLRYAKTDRWLYRHLLETGDEEKAIRIAVEKMNQCAREGRKKASEMHPCTMVYPLVKEIRDASKRYLS